MIRKKREACLESLGGGDSERDGAHLPVFFFLRFYYAHHLSFLFLVKNSDLYLIYSDYFFCFISNFLLF